MRDITLEDTIYIRFTTRAFATGIPTALLNTPVLSIYEENNLTQITAGVSVIVDYDSVSGLNQATIVATAANGYENGKSYDLVITTGTVDSVSVIGEVVGSFTVGSSAAAVDLANATDGLSALKTLIDAIPTTMRGTDNAATEAKQDIIDTVVDAVKVITDALPDSGALTAIGIDTARLTVARAAVLTDWIDAGRLDLILDELTVQGNTNETKIDTVNTDLSNATDGLSALKTLIDAVPTVAEIQTEMEENGASLLDTIKDELANGVDGLSALKTLIDAIPTTAMRGTDIGDLNNLSSSDVLTTALTESYAADGSTATLSQILYMVWSVINSLKFVTTTGTSRKLDGTTTAMTFTLDDADNPTDINRAT